MDASHPLADVLREVKGYNLAENPMPMLVDFFGLPGSGKSTLTNSLRLRLEEQGIKVAPEKIDALGEGKVGKIAIFFGFSFFLLTHPRAVLKLFAFSRPYLPLHPWKMGIITILLKSFYAVERRRQAARAQDYDVVLSDPSMLQSLWSLVVYDELPSVAQLDALLPALAPFLGDAAIYLELPPELSYARITRREQGWSRFAEMENDRALKMLAKYQPLFNMLAERYQALLHRSLARLEGNQEPQAVCERAATFLISILPRKER